MEGINCSSKIEDWKRFEKSNPTIVLNCLYIKEKEIHPPCISKTNSNYEEKKILITIPNDEKESCNYLAVKKLTALLRRITSKHHGHFYCSNCIHSFTTKNKLQIHEKVCKRRIFM